MFATTRANGQLSSPKPRRGFRRFLGIGLLVAVVSQSPPAVRCTLAGDVDTLLRVGFSRSMFTEVNENDVKAAMKVWAQTLMRERGMPVDPQVSVHSGIEDLSSALRGKTVDAFSLTTEEYWVLQREMHSSHVIVGVFGGRVAEEYVLLVHRESGFERVGDLRGRSVALFQNPRMSLASVWLDTLLLKGGLAPASSHFGRVTQVTKLPRVVLPVFFRQNDACVVTRRGFETMSELNPQVGRQLKAIAVSPELLPAGFFFRGDFSPSIRDRALVEFDRIHTTPAGQQALTVYQSERLTVQPISILDSSLELLENHRRLAAASRGAKGGEAPAPSREARTGTP